MKGESELKPVRKTQTRYVRRGPLRGAAPEGLETREGGHKAWFSRLVRIPRGAGRLSGRAEKEGPFFILSGIWPIVCMYVCVEEVG